MLALSPAPFRLRKRAVPRSRDLGGGLSFYEKETMCSNDFEDRDVVASCSEQNEEVPDTVIVR